MPDDAASRDLSNGRLNLEQQKKRAKELLRGLHGGDARAAVRLTALHPKAGQLKPDAAQLADAQLVVARECGFDSWPKLKGRTEALKAARDAAKRPAQAPDTPGTLHLRCGTDIRTALTRAGFVGAYHAFTDPFCQGPVPAEPRETFLKTRAAFVSGAYHLYPDVVLTRLRAEYGVLDDLSRHERIVLWFEHDSYDHLILAYLLKELGERETPLIELVCVDRIPAVARFAGLGQLAPEVIRLLWDGRVVVTPAHIQLGQTVWTALTDTSPIELFAIAKAGTAVIPPMAGALMRHLQELPSTRNGLSLTEQLALDLLADHGPMTARRLFNRLTYEREPLPFLGDAMFWLVLEGLAAGRSPLIEAPPNEDDHHQTWPARRITLTAHGEQVCAGRADWLADGPARRWIGGVEISPSALAWRWDAGANQPTLTPAR